MNNKKNPLLQQYVHELLSWNRRINLIGKSTEAEIWERHIAEGLLLTKYLPSTPVRMADFGSGAGIPGMILALTTEAELHLIESDSKKTAFLQHVAMLTGKKPVIHTQRMENLPPLECDIVTARACAPLMLLLSYAKRHLHKDGTFLFLKGKEVEQEISDAARQWHFTHKIHEHSLNNRKILVVQGQFVPEENQG